MLETTEDKIFIRLKFMEALVLVKWNGDLVKEIVVVGVWLKSYLPSERKCDRKGEGREKRMGNGWKTRREGKRGLKREGER